MHFPSLDARLSRIRLMIFDVDGVLTDGSLRTPHRGGGRVFNVHDGFGFYLARQAGLQLAICSGKDEDEIRDRAEALRVPTLRLGRLDKDVAVREILEELDIASDEAMFVGDDLFDLPGMAETGFAVAPADARPEVCDYADWVLSLPGGRGAVREAIEGVLKARGQWDELVAPFMREKA